MYNKICRHVKAPMQVFLALDARLDRIFTLILLVPCQHPRATRQTCLHTPLAEALLMGDTAAESSVYTSALLPAWVSSFGIPTTVASDHGRPAVQIFPLEFTYMYEPPGQWHHVQPVSSISLWTG